MIASYSFITGIFNMPTLHVPQNTDKCVNLTIQMQNEPADIVVLLEFSCPKGRKFVSETLNVINGRISYSLPMALTKYVGEIFVQIIIKRKTDGITIAKSFLTPTPTIIVDESINAILSVPEEPISSVVDDAVKAICDIRQLNDVIIAKLNAGELVGAQGQKGDKGEQGLKGDKGDNGEQGLRGERGLKGDIGQRGEQGPKGDKGESVTIVQSTGASTTSVMSQKSVTNELGSKCSINTVIYDWGAPEFDLGFPNGIITGTPFQLPIPSGLRSLMIFGNLHGHPFTMELLFHGQLKLVASTAFDYYNASYVEKGNQNLQESLAIALWCDKNLKNFNTNAYLNVDGLGWALDNVAGQTIITRIEGVKW